MPTIQPVDETTVVVRPMDSSVVVRPSEEDTVVIQTGGVEGPRGPVGPEGPQGDPGPSGSAASGVTFSQAVPAAVWHITHDLGYPPAITVIDTSGSQVEGDVVFAGNTVTLTFSAAFAGTAYLS